MPDLPIVEPFRVPTLNLTFSDRREATEEEWVQAISILTTVTMREWSFADGRDGRGWCADNDECNARFEAAFEAARASEPDLTLDDWRARGGEAAADPWGVDPRLQVIRFIARGPTDEIEGAFIWQNVEVLDETRGIVSIGFLPLMGVSPRPGLTVPGTWGEMGEVILTRDLPMRDGRSIRVEELGFPQAPDTDFRAGAAGNVSDMWTRINARTEGDQLDGNAPVKIRSLRRRPTSGGPTDADPVGDPGGR